MSPSEVRRIWGEPLDVTESETNRALVWLYANGNKAVFREAILVSWKEQETPSPQPEKVESAMNKPEDPVFSESRDLVREIAREIPSGPEGGGYESDPNANQIAGINPIPGQPNGMQPPPPPIYQGLNPQGMPMGEE